VKCELSTVRKVVLKGMVPGQSTFHCDVSLQNASVVKNENVKGYGKRDGKHKTC
jgi:hypothetical protein